MKRICVFGDSHVGSLRRAWVQHAKHLHELARIDFFPAHGMYWSKFDYEISPTTIEVKSSAFAGKAPLELSIGRDYDVIVFSSTLHSSPTYRHPLWQKFCLPCQSKDQPELHVISYSVVETWVTRRLQNGFDFLQALKAAFPHLVIFEPPKPLFRVPALYKYSRSVVVAADELHRKVAFTWLGTNSIDVLTTPEFTYKDGLTLESYSNATETDPHHGSALYSVAMLEKLLGIDPQPYTPAGSLLP